MDKDTIKSTLNKVFESFPYEEFCKIVTNANADKYVKKLKMIKLLYLLVVAQIIQTESLKDLADTIAQDKNLQKALHLTSISASTLSRRMRNIHHDLWAQTFSSVSCNLTKSMASKANSEPKDYRINIIDASTISLCLKKYLWAEFRGTKSGIKLHQRIVLHDGDSYPDKATLTPAKPADKSQMDELINTASDALNVFDRGYVDYKKWDVYCEQGIRFVSRLKANAIVNVITSRAIQTNDILITESIVVLGKPNATRMSHPLRLFETRDSQGNMIIIVTNDFSLDALEITEIYRLRWQVELFFKWIKQHLKVKKFFGTSPNAVYGQIWIALITFCLLRLLQKSLSATKTLLEVMRAVKRYLHQPFSELVIILGRHPTKTSLGRRSLNYEKEFEVLLKELEFNDTSFLDDTNIDLHA
jgi:hypothetical protein